MKNLIFSIAVLALTACSKVNTNPALFAVKGAAETGITFNNKIVPTTNLNIFNYMYFYNGGGVGAGDLNNDGKIDLVFTANLTANKIYLNTGNLKFEDITEPSNFKAENGWSTGVSIVDINQDGMLDIYISRVGEYEILHSHNLLFLCRNIDKNGVPHYTESSEQFGLNLVGFGTQAAFFDFDLDGDLDMFQLNHSVHSNDTFGKREQFMHQTHPLAGDKFFENKNGKYSEISSETGINQSALGYGLGLAISDVNLDGYPDMYVGNDFHENDYLYINQRNKTFKDELTKRINHTSRFSMGVDIADLNNDIFPEIYTLDMLPNNPEVLKRTDGEDMFYNFKFKMSMGYNLQFARNNLQLNNKNGYFSEIGLSAGVAATDWSWSTLLFDFENDGKKDIFVSNGINKRVNDLDFINFISSEDIQKKINDKKLNESDESLVGLLPELKIANKFFHNAGEMKFDDIEKQIEENLPSFSNGSAYVDLDNDGDMEIVTNNINQTAYIYENLSNLNYPTNKSLTLNLHGSDLNKNALGAKCFVFMPNQVLYQEKFPIHGFQSSMEIPICFGLGANPKIDSILIIWPDNSFQKLNYGNQKNINVIFKKGLPKFDYSSLAQSNAGYKDIAANVGLDLVHTENDFNDFDNDALIPNMLSTEGPALAVADINSDGFDDVFFGASKGKVAKVMIQNKNGKFTELKQIDIQSDSLFEDVDAVFEDFNADGFKDLAVVSGGNEYAAKSPYLLPRLYLNDGKGFFTKKDDAFANVFLTGSVITAADFNQDGKMDLFVGARTVSWNYGKMPNSYLLKNDGKGNFADVTETLAPNLENSGMVKNAVWVDYDKDNDQDLIVAYEWDGIVVFENSGAKFTKKTLTDKKGWWNFVLPVDIDLDGDLDFICGNLGTNSRVHASEKEPVRMYLNDYDDNGRLDQILTYYLEGKETIFADKREIEKQLPFTKRKFIYSREFAKASLNEVFGKEKIESAKVFEANYFNNAMLINNGKQQYLLKSLPNNAQYTSYYTGLVVNKDLNRLPNLLLMGNYFDSNIQMGVYDADRGNIFTNNGKYNFTLKPLSDKPIDGQFRKVKSIKIAGKESFILARNNNKLIVITK